MTTLLDAPPSTNSALVGSVEPRLWTKPLRPLTPATSYGFDVIDFAVYVLGITLFPWQEWLLIHACELRPDGLPRFRRLLICIARQNGKTKLLVVLSLYWLYIDRVRAVLGTSTKLSTAQDSWEEAVAYAEGTPELAKAIAPNGIRRTNGQNSLATVDGCRYRIAAANRKGGRGSTYGKIILDELREHHDWTAYGAAEPTTITIPDAQIVMLSNAGDDTSVVLNQIRDEALDGIDDGLGLFEWSAETDDPTSVENLLAANPSIGHNIPIEPLLKAGESAKAAGGEQLTAFVTEHLCRRVALLNPAIDLEAWDDCLDKSSSLASLKDNVAICVDISLDELHASAYGAAVDGEKVRVAPIAAWDGQQAIQQMQRDLPGLMAAVKPRVFGWFPGGPAATAAASLDERKDWPPAGVTLEALRSAVTAVCMGFAEQVRSRTIIHPDDPLLDAHVRAAEKLPQGDGWRFTRRARGGKEQEAVHVDAAYAAAGAVHLARLLPPRRRPRVIVGRSAE